MEPDALAREFGHEQLTVFHDPETGVTGAIAIHSTALGPAMGGPRLQRYSSLTEGLLDVLRLARTMSFKSAAAGLDLGGGKAILLDDGAWQSGREERMHVVGAAVDELGGSYITAEDVGTTPADMDAIAERTRHIAGVSVACGGRGDPSPLTARTVFASIEAAARQRLECSSLAALRVGVHGVGNVGAALVELLTAAGAEVFIADADSERCELVAQRHGVTALPLDGFLFGEFDVLAPCALGGAIGPNDVRRLMAPIVAGGANNPLSHRDVAAALAAKGVLYVPDFIANCGGIIHVGAEALHLSRDEAEALLAAARDRVERILFEARDTDRLPLEVAEAQALERMNRRREYAL